MIQLVAINSDIKINSMISGLLEKDSIDYRMFPTAFEGLEFLVSCKPSPKIVLLSDSISDLEYSELVPIVLDNYSSSKCLVLNKTKSSDLNDIVHKNFKKIKANKNELETYFNDIFTKEDHEEIKVDTKVSTDDILLAETVSPVNLIYTGTDSEILKVKVNDPYLDNLLKFDFYSKKISDFFTIVTTDNSTELIYQNLKNEFINFHCIIKEVDEGNSPIEKIYFLLRKEDTNEEKHNALLDKMLIINDITRSISTFLDFNEFVRHLCTHIQTIFTPDLTEYYKVKDGSELVLIEQLSKENDHTEYKINFSGEDLVFIEEKLNSSVLSVNLPNAKSHEKLNVYKEFESLFILPVYEKDNVISLIFMASHTENKFLDADLSALEVLSDIISITLKNISLYKDVQSKNKDMQLVISDLQTAKESIEEQALYLSQLLEETENSRQIIEQQNQQKEEELEKAAELQKNLLPEKIVENPYVVFESVYTPCTAVAGDIYDVVELENDKIGIVIADVSDHGASSAMIAAMFKMVFTIYSKMYDSPKKVLEEINKIMNKTITTGDYVTVFYTIFDPKTYELTYSSAGHPELLLVDQNGDNKQLLETNGFFIGMFDFSDYEEKKVKISSGDHIFFYTDGIYEIKNDAMEEYGKDRLWATFIQAIQEFSFFPLSVVLSDAEKYAQSQRADDDITMIHASFK
jgi:serine phosphatase RsbU (regulator of sigma subunit)